MFVSGVMDSQRTYSVRLLRFGPSPCWLICQVEHIPELELVLRSLTLRGFPLNGELPAP
jgi:hypothetical protein